MDEQRKEVIIREIKHWKQSKLLPAHYCDFLLTLYTEGSEDLDEPESKRFLSVAVVGPFIIVQLSFLFTALVIYFTDFSNGLQMLIGLIFSIIVFFIAKRAANVSPLLVEFYYFIFVLILFMLTIELVTSIAISGNLLLSLTVFIHCSLWFIIGLKKKMRFLQWAGILGLVVLVFFWLK